MEVRKKEDIKIAVYPFDSNLTNKYINRMVEAIKLAYPEAVLTAFPRIRNLYKLKNYDYVWLNWFENLPNKGKKRVFLLKLLILVWLKLTGVRIISSFHNRQPHDSNNSLLDRLIFRMVFGFSNRIIILSSDSRSVLKEKYGETILRKTFLIPHPTYDCYPKAKHKETNDFRVLFFGHLRPYKNIELILDLARRHQDISFTVAGSALNDDYEAFLKQQAETSSNVSIIPRYLTEEEIDRLIEKHSILLLPYNIKSSLNSGVVIHAICKRINVIVPAIGTVNQLKNKEKVYWYTYQSSEDHLKKIDKILETAKNEYETNRDKFEERIDTLYSEVTTYQSPTALACGLREVFQ